MRALAIALLVCLVAYPALADIHPHYQGPFAVQVNPPQVSFHVDGPPGVYEANVPVNVQVTSGFRDWSLFCEASYLTEVTSGVTLPADRICLAGSFQDTYTDQKSLVTLNQQVVIGRGTFTGPTFIDSAVLNLKFRSQWEDRPGTYVGQITFTFLATP
ncbi:MAG TPA: hypothetical protein VMU02_05225 [bacterium]|nr:hypothetical protein [bacterium]